MALLALAGIALCCVVLVTAQSPTPTLQAQQLNFHRALQSHDETYNGAVVTTRRPVWLANGAVSAPQFAVSGRTAMFRDSFVEAVDSHNATEFTLHHPESASWIVSARHAYNKPAGEVGMFVIRQLGHHLEESKHVCELHGFAVANKPVWTYTLAACRFAPLDYSQSRRGLVSDDGSTIAVVVSINATTHREAQLHVLDAQTGKLRFKHELRDRQRDFHGFPSVSARGDFITVVEGSRVDVFTGKGELRTKHPITIHHESPVYMDPSGDYLVHHDAASNLHIQKWTAANESYTNWMVVHARDATGVDWHPLSFEVSYGEAQGSVLLAVSWTRGRMTRTQSRVTLHDVAANKLVWSWLSTRSRSVQTEATLSFHAPYIGVASWSNEDGSDPQLMLFHTRAATPAWSAHTGGSMWAIDIVVASAPVPALQPNPASDVIFVVAAGSDHHAHMPGKGQAEGWTVTLTQ